MRPMRIVLLGGLLLVAVAASATIFGSVRGIVHDPQHRPVQGAMVMLRAKIVRLGQDHQHRRQWRI